MTLHPGQSATPMGPGNRPRSVLRAIGSLWFAAVLLVLWLVAMACATVYESTHGAERALAAFYTSWWFEAILALLAVNILAAVVVRYPFSKRQIGFVLTHAGILVTFAGALVTRGYGVNGQVGIAEGETVRHFKVDRGVLTLASRGDQSRAAVELGAALFRRFHAVDHPDAPVLSLNDVQVEVLRYLPDSEASRQVVNDNPHPQAAVEVSFSQSGRDDPTWVFANQTRTVGAVRVVFRSVGDEAELQRLLNEPPATQPAGTRTVSVEYQGSKYDVPVDECTGEAVPLGDTNYTVRVLQYVPHAMVGPDNEVRNAPDRPVNPAIQYEVVGAAGSQKGWAFSRFPDFSSMHGTKQIEGLTVTFVGPSGAAAAVPIEVLAGPGGELHARFSRGAAGAVAHRLEPDTPVKTPWHGRKFAVLQRFDHARFAWTVEPVDPVRKERTPALLVKLTSPEHNREMWLQKYRPHAVTIAGTWYELSYADKTIPLGFDLTLNKFEVGYYPGGRKPRSFESSITVVDPTTGRTQSRVVSMNNPAKFAGYSLYQSSYRQEAGRSISFLSVARDPGQPIIFAGYIAVMVGMLWVLVIRIGDRRRLARMPAACGADEKAESAGVGLPARHRAGASVAAGGLQGHQAGGDRLLAAPGAKSQD